MWSWLYEIFCVRVKNRLCVFFKDALGCFLFLPPLGGEIDGRVIAECFTLMNRYNKNTNISRIENVLEKDSDCYRRLKYKVKQTGTEYVCRQKDLAALRGGALKKKRACAQFFEKKYHFEYRPYRQSDAKACCLLFRQWMDERKKKYQDVIYQRLLDDSFSAFSATLKHYKKLSLDGRVICIEGQMKAVTIGYPLGKECFVVAFEVCDTSFRGIAQFIFREFVRELNYPTINIMDDSGLANLRRVKLSYRPYRLLKSYTVYQHE